EELLGVVVGEDDPEVGLERTQLVADVGRHRAHMLDVLLVLGVRHGEELGRVGQHGAADDGRHHGRSPSPIPAWAGSQPPRRLRKKYLPNRGTTRRHLTRRYLTGRHLAAATLRLRNASQPGWKQVTSRTTPLPRPSL